LYLIGLLSVFLFCFGLAGCGGGGGGGGNIATMHTHFLVVSSDATAVPNRPSIGTFDMGDQGDTAPELSISGAQTGLDGGVSQGIAISNDEAFVANSQSATITVYPEEGNGDLMPVATIAGVNTGLAHPVGVAAANGKLYVSDAGANAILIFKTTDAGNVAPMTTIAGPSTTLAGPSGIAVDSNGNIFVANSGNASVLMFPASASGDTLPTSTIAGSATQLVKPVAVALDGHGNLLVSDDGGKPDAVLFFTATDNGNMSPNKTISGAATMLAAPNGIALDSTGRTVVVNTGNNSIVAFPANATGNQSPNEMIQGAATALSSPIGLAVAVVPGPPYPGLPHGAKQPVTPERSRGVNAKRFVRSAEQTRTASRQFLHCPGSRSVGRNEITEIPQREPARRCGFAEADCRRGEWRALRPALPKENRSEFKTDPQR